ncbi:TonB-dependent receptor [Novosphingobium flavum]|uniref:TonB-dependent receptor n=1 Tax=Novosphingobium flavum TaxID=1778672 RepID=A0A7X1FTN5_9SPHN|nr:TonB-dependent receptor [Novosphingobium flavum]MBC2666639.1 TonB-dependent receptor [Novosphingobium flavum]
MRHQFVVALLVSGSAFAFQTAHAQSAADPQPAPELQSSASSARRDEEIIVTGSRVISNGDNSPTPITIMSTEALSASKPTTVFEGLLENPLVAGANGGKVAKGAGQGGTNAAAATLNLRGFGPTRNLVLLDGLRVPAQNLDGTVDLNQIPQLLLKRVDIAAGGASAVYGSDGITGVVNFVTDTKFVGVKANIQTGISQRGDDPTFDTGLAFGTQLFGGRGHFEASVQYHREGAVFRNDRPNVQVTGNAGWTLQGNGCAAGVTACIPFFVANNVRDGAGTFGGIINQIGTVANPFAGYNFAQDGLATPFVPGTPVGVGNNQVGGQGGFNPEIATMVAQQDFIQSFARFDYELTDDVNFHLAGFYDLGHQRAYINSMRSNGSSASSALATGFRMTVDNAFLPPSMAAAMKSAGVTVFNLGKYFLNSVTPVTNVSYTNRNIYVNPGFDGSLGKFKWQVGYIYSDVRQSNVSNNSWNTAKLFAALDSVNVNGVPTCWVLTQPQYAANFKGCVPMNIFGPTATTKASLDYVLQPTEYVGITNSHDATASISGPLFDNWAGPVVLALTGEYRRLGYELISDAPPANVLPLDCNGLGVLPSRTSCVQQSATNVGTTTIFPNGTAARAPVSQSVLEGAAEANVPLLKDIFFARRLDVNVAARYAKYVSNGSAVTSIPYSKSYFNALTWKIGLDWEVNDWLRLRGSRSRDFRAPNLSELYTPGRIQGLATATDYLTGAQVGVTPGYTANQQLGGNPNLRPEVGYTWTAGFVVKPVPQFSLAVDYYNIVINNAITQVDGSLPTIQNACYDSGGSSPYCALQVRPGGFGRTPANQAVSNSATLFYTQLPLNIAKASTYGWDFEANYRSELFGKPLSIRALVSYQPSLRAVQTSTPTTDAAGVSIPKVRLQASLSYNVTDAFRVDWSTRWRSGMKNVDPLLGLQVAPGSEDVAAVSFSNLNLSYRVSLDGSGDPQSHNVQFFLNVSNIFDQKPPVYTPFTNTTPFAPPTGAGQPGIGFYPADDAIGRAFYVGARVAF